MKAIKSTTQTNLSVFEDGAVFSPPHDTNGRVLPPSMWDIDWGLDLGVAKARADELIQKHDGESDHHYSLKLASIIFLEQTFWGLVDEKSILCEVRELKYRPDLSATLVINNDHNGNSIPQIRYSVCIECGDLSYRNKIEDLLNNLDYDIVIWIPYPPSMSSQWHYLVDVPFLSNMVAAPNSCENPTPYVYTGGMLTVAQVKRKKYVAKYTSFGFEDECSDIIRFLLFFKKQAFLTLFKVDEGTSNKSLGVSD